MNLENYIHKPDVNCELTLLTNIDRAIKDFYDNRDKYKAEKIDRDHCYEKCKNIIEEYKKKTKLDLDEREYFNLIRYIAGKLLL